MVSQLFGRVEAHCKTDSAYEGPEDRARDFSPPGIRLRSYGGLEAPPLGSMYASVAAHRNSDRKWGGPNEHVSHTHS